MNLRVTPAIVRTMLFADSDSLTTAFEWHGHIVYVVEPVTATGNNSMYSWMAASVSPIKVSAGRSFVVIAYGERCGRWQLS